MIFSIGNPIDIIFYGKCIQKKGYFIIQNRDIKKRHQKVDNRQAKLKDILVQKWKKTKVI